MSMAYIRKTYGVPAKRGGKIVFFGEHDLGVGGVIVGSSGVRLRIRLDGGSRVRSFHPTFCIEYVQSEKATKP